MGKRGLALSCVAWLLSGSAAFAEDRYAMPPPGYTPDMSSDEAGLWMQTDKAEAALKSSPALIRDEKVNAYVSKLICKLAAEYCPSIRVYVLETPEFNAFAMANGAVFVNTGLLLQSENEAQLAFVLGHELTHYLHRHTLQHERMAVNTSGFLAVFGIVTAGIGVGALGTVANTAGVGAIYSNSRDEERDADDNGFKLGTQYGYAPQEAPTIWRYMVDEESARPHNSKGLFLADHPASKERMQTLEKDAAEIAPTRSDWTVGADALHAATAPFVSRWISDELARGEPDQSVVIFRRLSSNLPTQGIYQYALGEAYRHRNKPEDAPPPLRPIAARSPAPMRPRNPGAGLASLR